jgi:hypothetical protein
VINRTIVGNWRSDGGCYSSCLEGDYFGVGEAVGRVRAAGLWRKVASAAKQFVASLASSFPLLFSSFNSKTSNSNLRQLDTFTTQLATPMSGQDYLTTLKPSSRGPLVRLP